MYYRNRIKCSECRLKTENRLVHGWNRIFFAPRIRVHRWTPFRSSVPRLTLHSVQGRAELRTRNHQLGYNSRQHDTAALSLNASIACCHTFFVIIWVRWWESCSRVQIHRTWWSTCWAITQKCWETLLDSFVMTAGSFFIFVLDHSKCYLQSNSLCTKIKKSDQTAWNEIPSNSTMSSLSQNLKLSKLLEK